MPRYKVYLKVMTSLLSGRKPCLVFSICLQWISRACVLHLQQLEGVEAIKHPLRQVGDLISIQHAGKSQHRLALDTGNDNQVDIYAHAHAQTQLGATYRELRERRPWKASGAISEIWLLLRSLC